MAETDVRRGGGGDAPAEFLWEEQVHRVCAVLSHRRIRAYRPGAPRRRASARQPVDSPSGPPPASPGRAGPGDQEVWRVRAAAGRSGPPGVFDLRFDWGVGRWTVTRINILEEKP